MFLFQPHERIDCTSYFVVVKVHGSEILNLEAAITQVKINFNATREVMSRIDKKFRRAL
jgi:hypothetical protein